ncbi:MAG: BamA/TamA family outer membrane protein [Chitinispirillaceae bacterium]
MIILLSLFSANSQDSLKVNTELTRESNRSKELLSTARKLIYASGKEMPDSLLVKESLQALRMCGLFSSARARRTDEEVTFLLTPATYIRDIVINGTFPLFRDDVERALTIFSGDIFRQNKLDRQDTLITNLYKRQGFLSPQVDISSREHPDGDDHIVLIEIKPGGYLRLKSLEVKGNHATFGLDIKRRLQVWRTSFLPGRAGRFIDAVFRDDVGDLISSYRSKRFAEVDIKDSVIVDSTAGSVRIFLNIEEGPRYRVRFSEESSLGIAKGDLEDELSIFESGNRNNSGVVRSISAMERRLQEEGFQEASVKFTDTVHQKSKFDEKVLTFDVNSGVRSIVSSININGADGIDEKSLRDQMLTVDKGSEKKRAYNPDVLEKDLFAIRMLYYSRGYLNTEVSSSVENQNGSVHITIDINEGTRSVIGKVTLDSNKAAGISTNELITLESGDILYKTRLKKNAVGLQNGIAEQGFPYVNVTPDITMSEDSSVADIHFRINRGPRVTLGAIQFIGAFRTQDVVLYRAVKSDIGDPLSLNRIVESQQEIRDLDLFSSVRFKTLGLRERWDTVFVFAEVAEKRPIYGTVGGGYRSDKGPFVHALAGDRNVLGRNLRVSLGGEYSQTGYGGKLGLEIPYFLGLPVNSLVKMSADRTSELNQNWATTAYGVSAGLNSSPSRNTDLNIGFSYERRRLRYTDAGVDREDIPDDDRPRNLIVITPSFAYDSRDLFTRPQKGVFFNSSADLSKGLGNTSDNFLKMRFEAQSYITPLSYLTFAGVVRGGYLYPYGGSTSVPADQLFYLGGTGDVRGYSENLLYPDSSGGTVSVSASIEARIMVGYNVELALFADAGLLEDDLSGISAGGVRSSVGTGFRYITPIGPAGVLYGWKIDRRPGEGMGAFHFSLGYTF